MIKASIYLQQVERCIEKRQVANCKKCIKCEKKECDDFVFVAKIKKIKAIEKELKTLEYEIDSVSIGRAYCLEKQKDKMINDLERYGIKYDL